MSTVYKHWEALVKRVWGRSWKALHSSKVGWLEKVTSWKMWLTPMLKSIQMNTFKQESPAHAAVKIDKACNIVFWGFHFQPFTNYFPDEHAWGPVSLERPDRWNFSTQEAIFATFNNHIKDRFDLPLCITTLRMYWHNCIGSYGNTFLCYLFSYYQFWRGPGYICMDVHLVFKMP